MRLLIKIITSAFISAQIFYFQKALLSYSFLQTNKIFEQLQLADMFIKFNNDGEAGLENVITPNGKFSIKNALNVYHSMFYDKKCGSGETQDEFYEWCSQLKDATSLSTKCQDATDYPGKIEIGGSLIQADEKGPLPGARLITMEIRKNESSIDFLQVALDKNGADKLSKFCEQQTGFPTWTIVLIALSVSAVLSIIAFVSWIYCYSRRIRSQRERSELSNLKVNRVKSGLSSAGSALGSSQSMKREPSGSSRSNAIKRSHIFPSNISSRLSSRRRKQATRAA